MFVARTVRKRILIRPMGATSVYEIGPSSMIVVVIFFGFIFLVILSLNFYVYDIMFGFKGNNSLESWQYVFS